MSPTVLAAVALAALILLIAAMFIFASGSAEEDRLTGDRASSGRRDPAELCEGRATYDQIKVALFRRAAAERGSDQAAYETIGSNSSIRMEAPVLRDEDAGNRAVTCNGTVTLDLPSSVSLSGGRRSVSADILYTVQPEGDGDSTIVALGNADELISTLSRLIESEETPSSDLPPPTANEIPPVEPNMEPLPPADGPEPVDTRKPPDGTAISPSFNCANARTSGEVAVCKDDRLAALDRRMAMQFERAISNATPQQRSLLTRTRDAFLRYRDRCPSNECIAQTYRGRMREIRDIMAGSWTPQR